MTGTSTRSRTTEGRPKTTNKGDTAPSKALPHDRPHTPGRPSGYVEGSPFESPPKPLPASTHLPEIHPHHLPHQRFPSLNHSDK